MIAVTGATGHLGHLVVTGLLDAGVPAAEVVAVVRTPGKAADLAARGVQVRQADYTDRTALEAALQGVDRLLLVSGSEVGQRVAQHTNVLQAARAGGVALVVYTSASKADDTPLPLAPEHIATERLIADLGIPAVVLRNNWYFENYDQQIRQAAETGALTGSAGDGRVAAATRADYAAAAVAVLTADQPTPGTLELGGDQAWSLSDLAAAVSTGTGRDVTYRDLSPRSTCAASSRRVSPRGRRSSSPRWTPRSRRAPWRRAAPPCRGSPAGRRPRSPGTCTSCWAADRDGVPPERAHRSFGGTSYAWQISSHTVRTGTPASIASAAVRPPSGPNTWSWTTLCDRIDPNCRSIRDQNSCCRTPMTVPSAGTGSHPRLRAWV